MRDAMRIVNTLLVALVALQRGVELAISKRNRLRLAEEGAEPASDPCFPTMVLAHLVLILGSALEPWLLDRPFVPAIGIPALVLCLAAQALRAWVMATLGRHWNARIVRSVPLGVVTSGPYRWIRHPNYLVLIVETLTLPLIQSAWITWILVQLIHTPVLARRIRDEERVLLADPAYRATMGGKPRFLPRRGATA